MAIKTLNPDDYKTIRKGEPTLRFTRKGIITISVTASEILGLKEDNPGLLIAYDEQSKQYYFAKAPSNETINWKLRKRLTKGAFTGYSFNSTRLANEVIDNTILDVPTNEKKKSFSFTLEAEMTQGLGHKLV